MEFEFDPAKDVVNLAKHGIDFTEAQAIWDDPKARFADATFHGEARYLVTGKVRMKLWTAVFALRGERRRIISVRRARGEEVVFYEQDG